jgi:hypothetical protein
LGTDPLARLTGVRGVAAHSSQGGGICGSLGATESSHYWPW